MTPVTSEATDGWASSQPYARCTSLTPCAAAYAENAASSSHGASCSRCDLNRVTLPSAGAAVRLYFPVSRPFCNGKYGRAPRPNARTAGSSSSSGRRHNRLYSNCADTNPCQPRPRATWWASATCHAAKLELPAYRIFPSRTRSSSVDSVSSTGVCGSGLWI